ncbi:cytochrome P450 9e2-like [Hylaeus volcanicus]|uniref:cytochrome P450 9e2-like n=1 Tax=Hylaeus volcanicus TaxID=313075 RepID=UPI0023B7EFAB|nr:cytochrome P450 9e2-like [Hylaeus volcanicus]XP_053977981.1 cytochrome P450 9e2-like [Hylaeus volcanicus]
MDPFATTLILVTVFLLLYRYLWKPMNYFKQLGIPHAPWIPILGHIGPVLFRCSFLGEHAQKMYNRFPDAKYFGFYIFTTPVIILRDPELITLIAIKEFDSFTDHLSMGNEDMDPLMGKTLFFLRGDSWREMRKLLSPAFSSAKMKIMFNLITDCADSFTKHIAEESKDGKVYHLEDTFGRYGTDMIATSCFGISVDSMKNPNNEFYVFAKQLIDFTFLKVLKILIGRHFPSVARLLGIKVFDDQTRSYFTRVITETVNMRKEKGIYRPDMIQLMMESGDTSGKELTIDEMTNQAFSFFQAGYGTSSTVLSFVVYELAVNPEIQARLRAEIEEIARKTDGRPTYDAIKGMAYLDAVLNETARLYPVTTVLDRVCVKEFEFPPAMFDSKPVTIKPGAMIGFMPFATQRDPKYFPDPLRFDPDRFLSGEIPQKHFFPFGLGPRICIGNRFAMMVLKIALFYLLLRCDFEPCAQTTIPMRLSKKSVLLAADKGFWLNFKTRENKTVLRTNDANGEV